MIKKDEFLSIETYCPCFNGFYETLLSSLMDDMTREEYLFDNYEAVDDKYKQYIYDNEYKYTDNKLLMNDISKQVIEFYNDYFKENNLLIKFKFQELISPKYYNYSTDSINIKVLTTKQFLIYLNNYICDNTKEFREFIKSRYTSCSGFYSSYSNDYETWLSYLNEESLKNNAHLLGSFLDFYFQNEIREDIDINIYYYCHEHFYSNGYIFDDKYFNTQILVNDINKEFNLNIENLEDLENEIEKDLILEEKENNLFN